MKSINFSHRTYLSAWLLLLGALSLPAQTPTKAPSFIQRGRGAVARDLTDKLQDFVNVRDFGAKCDGGKSDDREAIQAAIDAAGGSAVYFPGDSGCGVSAPGIKLYPANNGITLVGQAGLPVRAYAPGQGSGLVAFRNNPPKALLTNMAEGSHLQGLYLDCNNGAATNGLVNVVTTWAIENYVTATHCGGDGMQVFTEGTPVTTQTSPTPPGTTSFTVEAITGDRISFGKDFCTYMVIDYGGLKQESLPISRVEGNEIIAKVGSKFGHDRGAKIRCHGNANDMHIDHFYSFNNGLNKTVGSGWGFRVIPGSDNNAIWWSNHNSNNNFSGGELWFGSLHKHFGGDYEGDSGPAIQLGASDSRATTAFMSIFPIGDLEESSVDYNAISVVCDNSSQINATVESSVIIQTGSKACPNYPRGSTSGIYGTFIGGIGPGFWSHTASGYVEIVPGNPGTIRFLDAGHNLLSSVDSSHTISPSAKSTMSAEGTTTGMVGASTVTDITGPGCSNGAICVSLKNAAGDAAWPAIPGTQISIRLEHYSLPAGPNTLTFNGKKGKICSHFDPEASLGRGYSLGGILNVTLNPTGCWMDSSQ